MSVPASASARAPLPTIAPNFHADSPAVKPGRWLRIREGNHQRVLLTTGAGLQIAMDWSKSSDQVDRAVYSVALWSMADKAVQAEQLCAHEDVLSLDGPLLDGGFGSRLLEARILLPALVLGCRYGGSVSETS